MFSLFFLYWAERENADRDDLTGLTDLHPSPRYDLICLAIHTT